MLTEIICAIFILTGVIFIFISSIGVVRLPDFYIRVSAITKAATLGVASIMVGTAIYFNDITIAIKAAAVIVFLLITSPIAAHIIGRAAYWDDVPLWERTKINQYKDYIEELKSKTPEQIEDEDEDEDDDDEDDETVHHSEARSES